MSLGWIQRHPLPTYFFLAYAFSWLIAVPLALQAQGLTDTRLPFALHYLTAFGPALAALITASLLGQPFNGTGRVPGQLMPRPLLWWMNEPHTRPPSVNPP